MKKWLNNNILLRVLIRVKFLEYGMSRLMGLVNIGS